MRKKKYSLHLLIHLNNPDGQHYQTIAPRIRTFRKPEMRKMPLQQSVFTIILHINGHFCKCTQPSTEKVTAIQPADVAHNSRYIFYTIRIIKVDKQVQEILVDIKKLITPPTSGEEEEIQPAPDGEIHIEVPVPDGQITVEVDKEEGGNSGIGGDIGDWDDEMNVDIIV